MILLHVQLLSAPGPRSDLVIDLPGTFPMIMNVWMLVPPGEVASLHEHPHVDVDVEVALDRYTRRADLGPGLTVECRTIEDALNYLRKELAGSPVM